MVSIDNTSIKAAILDMDGVLWRSNKPLCDLKKLFNNFEKENIKVVMATNNGLKTVADNILIFNNLGISIDPWQIITSAVAIAHLVKKQLPNGGPVYIMGEPALHRYGARLR